MSKKLHIGIHCYEYPPCKHGGVGSFTKDLAESLVKEGYKVTVFGFYFDFVLKLDNRIDETINGVNIIRLPQYKKFSNSRLNFIFSRIKLYNIIKELHKSDPFDIIESPEGSGWLPLGTPFGIPLITRLHGGTTYIGKELKRKISTIASFFEKNQLQRSNQIISVSEYTAKKTFDYLKINKKYIVIYNSVQLPKNLNCLEYNIQNKMIVFSGSISHKKGVEELLKAMNIVCEKIPQARLMLAGKNTVKKDGKPYEEYLLELVEKQYRKNIHFLGVLNREKELFPLLCEAEICCYPSHVESFALAPLEAMALGKPVIYSKLHSGKEAIEHGKTGLLCNPKEPEDIAKNILILFDNKELENQLGENAKKIIEEKFNYTNWIGKNIELYKNVVGEI